MRAFILFLLCAMCQLVSHHAAAQEAPAFDPYHPAQLHAAAVRHARQGDTGTALILLERAHLLAPHDERIARSLQLLRTQKQLPEAASTGLSDGAAAGDAAAIGQPWPKP